MLELTHFEKIGGPLTKRIYLNDAGKLVSDGSACVMTSGRAKRVRLPSVDDVASFISSMASSDALALGRLRGDLAPEVSVTTQARLASLNGSTAPDLIARTANFIQYAPAHQALALIDIDTKGMPAAVAARIDAVGGFWEALCIVMPCFARTARITRRSTSSGLLRTDTGDKLPGSNGLHIYISVADGGDIERFLYTLHDRCWLAGFGWHMVGAGGQLLDRSLVDRMVHAPERLVFEGAPVLGDFLQQDSAARAAVASHGNVMDTREACPPLRIVEASELKDLKSKSAYSLAADRATEKERFISTKASALAKKTSVALPIARRIIERQTDGILRPDLELEFDNPELKGTRVADILAAPETYVGETLSDPLEGVEYGRGKAKIMLRADGSPWIHSFAHGRTIYELKFDAKAVREVIDNLPNEQTPGAFVQMAMGGDLDQAETEELRNHVADLAGVGKRALTAQLRDARQEKSARDREERANRKAAQRKDTRPKIDAPLPDAPWLPVMAALNDVLSASKAQEPPMRDIDGIVTQVRVRRVLDLHPLTRVGVNDGDTKETRLPAPEQPLLTRLDETSLSELIERHIDFVDPEEGRSVHLGGAFVKHYRQRGDNVLPVVSSVASLPIVGLDGRMLCAPGLDRELGIVFRIPPELQRLLPDRDGITDTKVAAAMKFLTEEWLVDVLTDYTGKATLIAAALTIIQRALLPERPAFFVTAGRRGGGKTTALMMLMTAVTGVRPSAAAWSSNEEEHRKGLLGYLMEGLSAIIYDNIPRGAQLSCPHIEKAITSSLYSDRILGINQVVTVNASTVILFTGNNIGPKGDMAPRSLRAQLEVDRADPENREFRHPDPVGWTEANRGKILRALYTVLLGNPSLGNPDAVPETRFKT